MIEFTRQLKMKMNPIDDHIRYEKKDIYFEYFNISNFTITKDAFLKYMPYNWEGGYYLVTKDKVHYNEKLFEIKLIIIAVQVFLLTFFASISYILALRALRPMQNAIVKLDNFSKDLIHDLNTPITSMLLNMKILEKNPEFSTKKPLQRIKQSLLDIGELHSNLIVLLQEDTMIIQEENIFEIVQDVAQTHRKIFQNLQIIVKEKELYRKINKDAFKQVLVNIVSNACKYNVEDGYVKISMVDDTLIIEDGGVGIKNPQQIFERSYKEHVAGHGIGLDIVKRLCEVMNIKVSASSKLGEGTKVFLSFKG